MYVRHQAISNVAKLNLLVLQVHKSTCQATVLTEFDKTITLTPSKSAFMTPSTHNTEYVAQFAFEK